MCGRYVAFDELNWREYCDLLRLGNMPASDAQQSFNLTPTQQVLVVRDFNEKREALPMAWWLIPGYARGIRDKYSTFICRIETMETKASFKSAWKRGQRCILPAKGFYEFFENEDGSKQPYYIRPSDPGAGAGFLFAGLWESSTTDEGVEVLSCTMITMPANVLLAEIHNRKERMPAILQPEDVETWLTGTPEEARKVLHQYPAEMMMAWRVSKKVNNSKNNGPELIQPLDAA